MRRQVFLTILLYNFTFEWSSYFRFRDYWTGRWRRWRRWSKARNLFHRRSNLTLFLSIIKSYISYFTLRYDIHLSLRKDLCFSTACDGQNIILLRRYSDKLVAKVEITNIIKRILLLKNPSLLGFFLIDYLGSVLHFLFNNFSYFSSWLLNLPLNNR